MKEKGVRVSEKNDVVLKLILAKGPTAMEHVECSPEGVYVLGRSSSCEIPLIDPDASISRRHLEVSMIGDQWMATDLGSRNGTQHNGGKMTANTPTALQHGDVLRLGSWVFRVSTRSESTVSADSTMIHTLNDTDQSGSVVERVRAEPLANLASHRLAILLECADQIHGAEDLRESATIALHALVESTGFTRAAFLSPLDDPGQYETLAFESENPLEDVSSVNFSQSLLESAAQGDVVRLSGTGAQADYGQSIAELDIHSALCVPVMIEDDAIGFMYLDARGSESAVKHDASAFGRAVGRLLGLRVANLRGKELEIQQHEMQYDLDAAAKAQRLLLPDSNGTVGPVSYSMMMRPGRMVAGDLFGVVELKDGRVCTFLGDVSGKGAGAAIMMATTQSYLHAMFEHTNELSEVMTMLNKHIAERSRGQFVTMWIGVFSVSEDGSSADVEFIDAGHGHWLVTTPGQNATRPTYHGGLVVGIDPGLTYESEQFQLGKDQRLVLFSDGVVEQTSPGSDEEYGLNQAGALLQTSKSYAEDVSRLLESVLGFAQSEDLRDDTTIASVGIG